MGTFLKKLAIFFALLLSVLVSFHPFFYATSLNQNYLLKYKLELLERAHERPNKLVIVGGSNARFGLDSQELSKFVSRPVINASVDVHEGLNMYLDMAQRHLRPGDTLLMSPEYGNLEGRVFFGTKKVVRDAYTYPDFYSLVLSQPLGAYRFVEHTPWHVLNLIEFFGRLRFLKDRDAFEKKLRGHFDEFGDWNSYVENPDFASFPVRVGKPHPTVVELVSRRVEALRARGIRCLWVYPPVRRPNLEVTYPLDHYQTVVAGIDGLRVVGTAAESIYEEGAFYDSPYHLNRKASLMHTRRLAPRIREAIQR